MSKVAIQFKLKEHPTVFSAIIAEVVSNDITLDDIKLKICNLLNFDDNYKHNIIIINISSIPDNFKASMKL